MSRKTEIIGVRVTKEMKEELKKKCRELKLSECIRRLLYEFLE